MTALYCPCCEHVVEELLVVEPASVPYGELNSYADIEPGETYYKCAECGSHDVDYVRVCNVCGSADDIIEGEERDICDECLSHLAEDSERFERFLTVKGLSKDFYLNFVYDCELSTIDEDKVSFDVIDIVRAHVHDTLTACDFADLAKEYLTSAVDDAAIFIKEETGNVKTVQRTEEG